MGRPPHRMTVYLFFFFFFFFLVVVVYLVTIDRQECKYRHLSLFSLYTLDRYKPPPPSPLVSTTYQHHHLCIYTKKKCGFSFSLRFFLQYYYSILNKNNYQDISSNYSTKNKKYIQIFHN
jgi:hypothetical protein